MDLDYDRDADAVYIHLRNLPYAFGEDLDTERRIDYAADGQPVGIELLNASRGVNLEGLPESEDLLPLLAQHGIKAVAPRR